MHYTVIWNDCYCDGPECCIEVVDIPLTPKGVTRQKVRTAAFEKHYGEEAKDEGFFHNGMESFHEVAIILGVPEFV